MPLIYGVETFGLLNINCKLSQSFIHKKYIFNHYVVIFLSYLHFYRLVLNDGGNLQTDLLLEPGVHPTWSAGAVPPALCNIIQHSALSPQNSALSYTHKRENAAPGWVRHLVLLG